MDDFSVPGFLQTKGLSFSEREHRIISKGLDGHVPGRQRSSFSWKQSLNAVDPASQHLLSHFTASAPEDSS